MNEVSLHCYGVRRLNPFLGLTQVIEKAGARASSCNGLTWRIEVLGEPPKGWGSLSRREEKAWLFCGMWSEQEGFVPAAMSARQQKQCHSEARDLLIEEIIAHQSEMPFPLADRRELWLLDEKEQRPMALLHAMQPEAVPPRPAPRYWRACLGGEGLNSQPNFPQSHDLEIKIKQMAGFNRARLWVNWERDRRCAYTDHNQLMSAKDFPECGIREVWLDDELNGLVTRYIQWMAPALLTLPYISEARRAFLEGQLSRQAHTVEYHWRLYPKMVDASKLTAARVKARLQSAGA
jgi:hypothetical protein